MSLKKRAKVSAAFSMSSLTDIIFLLLIFFMLTSSMVVPNALNLKMPGQSKSNNQPKYPPLEIRIAKTGNYTMNDFPASRSEIEKKVRELKNQRENLSLIIYPDKQASNQHVVAILDIAYRYRADAILGD